METPAANKVDQAISDLELLKIKIVAVTARYNVLKEDYSRLCEDAIASLIQHGSISDVSETSSPVLQEPVAETGPAKAPFPVPVEAVMESGPAVNNPNVPAAEKTEAVLDEAVPPEPVREKVEPYLAGCPSGDTAVPLSENRSQVTKPSPKKNPPKNVADALDVRISRAPSLEEIIAFQERQLYAKPPKKKTAGKKISAQSVVDIIGDGIENGLDKLGNGLMFPFARIADLSHKNRSSNNGSKQ